MLCFREPRPVQSFELESITKKEWQDLSHWLDVSGLALYLLDRLVELELTHLLPEAILGKLQLNLHENTQRLNGMMSELEYIHGQFRQASMTHAVLKGASLDGNSVPRLECRHQFDLDLLLAEDDITQALRILEARGYRLYAVSGGSWEFKKDEKIGISMRDFYKDSAGRTVEVHVQPHISNSEGRLSRVEMRAIRGIELPVLSSVDLFLGQAMHVYKHVCGEYSRAAHFLEFYRHVLFRRDDKAFWLELRKRGEEDPRASLAIGVITLLITNVMGSFAPRALTEWTVDELPAPEQMWVNLYGNRVVFGDVPGSKLYLLLNRELALANSSKMRTLWQTLLPRHMPPMVVQSAHDERLFLRMQRYRMQWRYLRLRLRFHIVEGFRYGREAYRWKRLMRECTR